MTPLPDVARLRDEFSNQYDQLKREKWVRLTATALGFSSGLIFLPVWIVLPLAAVNLSADLLSMRLLRDVERLIASTSRRRAVVACVFLLELAFLIPPGLMWHNDDPFAKSLAVGLAASAMMHVATVRSIHLPHGLWGGAGLSSVVLASNTLFWTMNGMWPALALTTLFAATSLGYFLIAMVTNHNVHAEANAGQRTAKEAVAAKDRLLATISHELRTPLNGILGMGHAELAQSCSPEARARMSVLVASAEGLSVILDDILDLSAARDGRLLIRPQDCVPAEEIAAAVTLFRHGNAGSGTEITLDTSPELSRPARFDRQRLRQCLSNLLSNALRHGRGAPVRVRAALATGPRGQPVLDLIVADDGPGVPETLRASLFEPFARLDDPMPEGVRQGQGLGLSIARSLARLMGGDLVLEPPGDLGQGAVFRLTLDLVPALDAALPLPPVMARGLPLAARRVLVVDDIATNRLVAQSCLRLAGAEVVEAESGVIALGLLAAGSFDAVCLDMNMPGLDGLATLARIRQMNGSAAQVAVIAMTADAGEDKRAFYLASGCDGYLAKPITPDSASSVLAKVLAVRQAGAG